jgi:predicted dehydrogenase
MNFAILGTGMVAAYHQAGIEGNATIGARVTAMSHHEPVAFSAVEERFGVRCKLFDDVLADESIDVVCICTPSGQHAEQAVAAAQAGKHVLVEKPMALTLADADAIISAADQAGVKLGVALQRRTDPLFQSVRRALVQGDLGDLTLASVVLPYYRDMAYYNQADWRGTWALDGGGVLMNQGIHIIDLLLWFMGDPVEIKALGGTLHRDIEVEDVIAAVLRFGQGALATVTATTTVGGGAPHRVELFGTNGAIEIEGEGVVRWDLFDAVNQTVAPPALDSATDAGAGADPKGISAAGHTAIIRELIGAIREDRKPAIDGHEGRRSLAVVNGIYEAAGLIESV